MSTAGSAHVPAVAYTKGLTASSLGEVAASLEADFYAFGFSATTASRVKVFTGLEGADDGPKVTMWPAPASSSRTNKYYYLYALAAHYQLDAAAREAAYDAAVATAAAGAGGPSAGGDACDRPDIEGIIAGLTDVQRDALVEHAKGNATAESLKRFAFLLEAGPALAWGEAASPAAAARPTGPRASPRTPSVNPRTPEHFED